MVEIGHSLPNSSLPLQHFLKRSCFVWVQSPGDGLCKLATRFGIRQRV